MKFFKTLICCFFCFVLMGQNETDIFQFDLSLENNTYHVSNGKNISDNKGYDNQPSFLNNERILYASTRNGQTDIAQYYLNYKSRIWINFTEGGEYSPQKVPQKNEVSAVRLDKDGLQRLYSYNLSNGESTKLIKNLVVAYYTWYNDHTIVSAVIENEVLNLFVSNLNDGSNRKYDTNVGRSFHKIPNSNLVSYISKKNDTWQIRSLNPVTGDTKLLANTPENVEDICWLNATTILASKENTLYKLTLKRDNQWQPVANLKTYGITKISRLAVSPDGTKILVVAEFNEKEQDEIADNTDPTKNNTNDAATTSVETIVQQQLNAYNTRDIEAFMATFSKDIKLYNYPNELQTEGKSAVRKSYEDWFKRVPDLKAIIKKRIVIGNKVIDEEQVTANGQTFNAVAIYEIENGLINKVTFILK